MRILFSVLLLSVLQTFVYGQYVEDPSTGKGLVDFEKRIEQGIVAADISFLQKAYADDFRFKHSTGLVDGKDSWLKDVEKNKGRFISRSTDSVEVEIHNTIGITNGRLTVTRKDRVYILKYVRVYIRKDDEWQMIMHRSVQEIK